MGLPVEIPPPAPFFLGVGVEIPGVSVSESLPGYMARITASAISPGSPAPTKTSSVARFAPCRGLAVDDAFGRCDREGGKEPFQGPLKGNHPLDGFSWAHIPTFQ